MICPKCSAVLKPRSFRGRYRLSDQESRVCDLLVEGNSTECAALQLGLSEGTVKNYESKAKKKIGVSSRVGLVRVAFGMEAV